MFQYCFVFAILFFLPALVSADDALIVKQLEALGGKVTVQNGKVVEVQFRNSKDLQEAQWRMIGQLSELKKLTVYGGAKGLNDDTVGFLTGFKKLESLSTDGAQLSDEGLAKLADIQSLKSAAFFHLSFRKDGFSGRGFAAWQELPNLEKLTVAGMSMGDAGFAAISGIQSLKELRTWHTYRTEKSNALIAKLPNLISLKLGQRLPRGQGAPLSLSDASIPVIANIKTLETLEIGEADFSVSALQQLKDLPRLKRLKIDRTELTPAEMESLKQSLPGVRITFEPITKDQREKLKAYLR